MNPEQNAPDKTKSNAGWNINAVVDRLDSIALFALSSVIAVVASLYYYKQTLPEDKYLTFGSFVTLIGIILFSYKWVQKQVLKNMTDNVMEAINLGFKTQNEKLDKFGTKLDSNTSDISKIAQDVAYLRGRFERDEKSEKDSSKKTDTDS